MLATMQRRPKAVTRLGPEANGLRVSPRQYDRAEFDPDWRYELVNGVLIVCPPPLENERDPNDELGRFLRNYQEFHDEGSSLDMTLPEHEVIVGSDRRRHQGKRLVFSVFSLPEIVHRVVILSIADEMIAADAFDGENFAVG